MTDPIWAVLRQRTQARIGLHRVGNALATNDMLGLRAAHAAARDAVHEPLDVDAVSAQIVEILGPAAPAPILVQSRAEDRAEYLRRPDLGRAPRSVDELPVGQYDVAVIVADGLSSTAVADGAAALVGALWESLPADFAWAPVIIATQARVAIGDAIGEKLGAATTLVIIGERPGLSVADSLGIYLTYGPKPGRADSERNCISNIHPHGLSPADAARITAGLVAGARKLGRSGVALKDTSRAELAGAAVDAITVGDD